MHTKIHIKHFFFIRAFYTKRKFRTQINSAVINVSSYSSMTPASKRTTGVLFICSVGVYILGISALSRWIRDQELKDLSSSIPPPRPSSKGPPVNTTRATTTARLEGVHLLVSVPAHTSPRPNATDMPH